LHSRVGDHVRTVRVAFFHPELPNVPNVPSTSIVHAAVMYFWGASASTCPSKSSHVRG